MKADLRITIVATVAATGLCAAVGFIATGSILALVPALLLARYVWADFEGTFTAAVLCIAGLSLIALAESDARALVVALGGYAAAEIAHLGARTHRRQARVGHAVSAGEVAANVTIAAAATALVALVGVLHTPAWLAVSALFTLVAAAVAVAVGERVRRAQRPSSR